MPRPASSGLQRVVRWLTATTAVIVLGVLGYSFLSGNVSGPSPLDVDNPTVEPPPITDLLGAEPQGAGAFTDLLSSADTGSIEIVEEGRVTAEVRWEQLNPLPGRRMHLTRPSAWIYLSDTQALRVQAREANLVTQPGAREPESGSFEGDVRLRLYRFVTDDVRATVRALGDAGLPEPAMIVRTETLYFDAPVGELRTPDHVEIEGPGYFAEFEGFEALVNESQRRLASMRTDGGGRIVFDPTAPRATTNTAGPVGGARTQTEQVALASTPGAAAPAGVGPRVEMYEAQFLRDVNVTWGGRTIDADALTLWARLVDGGLREGAIAEFGGGDPALREAAPAPLAPATPEESGPSPAGLAAPAAAPAGFSDDAIILTWSGPLQVEPALQTPLALERDDVALRFTAPTSGAVEVVDAAASASARCVTLDYMLTTARLTMTGAGDVGVTLRQADRGEALAGRFELDLLNGLGAFPGPGALRAVSPAPDDARVVPTRREISWRERSDFVFATRDGRIDFSAPAALREAIFSGAVEARDGRSNIGGDTLRAYFRAGADARAQLARIVIEEGARIDAGAEGRLAAQRVDVSFEESPGEEFTPSVATAQGGVRGQRDGALVRAELVEARFTRDELGELALASFFARDDVFTRTAEGVETEGDELRIDAAARTASVAGAPAIVRREGGQIAGPRIDLNDGEKRLTVFGAGEATYGLAPGETYTRVHAVWAESMRYDDLAGSAAIEGDAEVTAFMRGQDRDIARGARIDIALTPAGSVAAGDGGDALGAVGGVGGVGDEFAGRALQLATIHGEEAAQGRGASLESRRYFAIGAAGEVGAAPALSRLLYLEGGVIYADALRNELRAPGRGQLLIENRTGDGGESPGATRGTSLFEWRGGLTLDRGAGVGRMHDQVRLRHLPPDAASAAELECETIEAAIDTTGAGDAALTSATARGAVYAIHEGRQLIADELVYNALKGVATATASPTNAVILFDRAQATPLTGRSLAWDFVRDRVTWLGAGSTTTTAPDPPR